MTYLIRNIQNLLRYHEAVFIVKVCPNGFNTGNWSILSPLRYIEYFNFRCRIDLDHLVEEFDLQINRLYLYLLMARKQDGCHLRYLHTLQSNLHLSAFRLSARITGKSCVAEHTQPRRSKSFIQWTGLIHFVHYNGGSSRPITSRGLIDQIFEIFSCSPQPQSLFMRATAYLVFAFNSWVSAWMDPLTRWRHVNVIVMLFNNPKVI